MTKDEIKQAYSMREIVERYGFKPNRSGFIRCPFHQGDKTASLKIYKDNFYCYGCGATGDIFSFVMLMDGLSFKDALVSLGGNYDKPETKRDAIHRKRDLLIAEKKRLERQDQIKRMRQEILFYGREMDTFRSIMNAYKPFSPPWCDCMNGFTKSMQKFDFLWEEVNKNGLSEQN